jgi:hypothetical protein
MYPQISSGVLYHEYEARAAEAVRKHALAVEARAGRPYAAGSRRLSTGWARLAAWWNWRRDRFMRSIEPAEEGYIA